ncbi:flowering-promoting factor 1-like [Magnolia sinica]|uniref:flowering-promoting factor 1-like n=1 Tax=Magnolia sinica TaxID=86752 RepID=UPI00265B3A73|nr:flowering-promoting factor 1-like [Magnolia sinica]
MSGVWVFKDGVMRLENPATGLGEADRGESSNTRRKVLVYTPTNEVIASYTLLERRLAGLGWERYYDKPNLIQFHKRSSNDLISLPKDVSKFNSVYMFDIVLKNQSKFQVRDM